MSPQPHEPRAGESQALAAFVKTHADFIVRLHHQSGADRWELPPERFAAALYRSAEKRFRGTLAPTSEVEAYLAQLHLEDLALAASCAASNEAAWEAFVARYRPEMRAAARAILHSGQDARAEELADGLFAELWGVGPKAQVRPRSLFEYFHGRSKLSTWLRSVLAQRYVDSLRTGQKTISLEDGPGPDGAPQPRHAPAAAAEIRTDPYREQYLAQLDAALRIALAELPPRDRMLLALFYIDGNTLAQIGRIVREHESTVSRQLERSRRALRESVTAILSKELGAAQIELVFDYALEDWPFDLSRALSAEGAARETGAGPGVSAKEAG